MKAIQEDGKLLIFRVGSIMCCVSARDVDSVIMAQPLTKIPHQAASACGVLSYRGDTVSVINVFKKFDFPTPEDPQHGVFIMAYTRHGVVGYWVDQVIDITKSYATHWMSPPKFMDGNIFDKTLNWNDQLVLLTDFERLFAMYESAPLHQWVEQQAGTKPEETLSVVSEVSAGVEPSPPAVITEAAPVEIPNEDSVPLSAVTEISSLDLSTVLLQHDLDEPVETLSTMGSLDTLSDLTKFDENELQENPANSQSNSSTIKLNSEIAVEPEPEVLSVTKNRNNKRDSPLEKKSSLSRSAVTTSALTSKPAATKSQTKSKEHAECPADYASHPAQAIIFDYIKLSMKPTSAQLQWNNDPYTVAQQQPSGIDIEKLFKEKIGPRAQEYFASVEATHHTPKISEPDTIHSDLLPLEPLSDIDSDSVEVPAEENNRQVHRESVTSSHPYAVSDLPETPEIRQKKEASIRKVIKRIENALPDNPGVDRLRLMASALLIASILFVLQHFNLLPGINPSSEVSELELLTEKGITTQLPVQTDTAIDPVSEPQKKSSEITTQSEIVTPVSQPTSAVALTSQVLAENSVTNVPKEITSSKVNTAPPEFNSVETIYAIQWNKHSVLRGETLWGIAGVYLNNPFRYPDLARWNRIHNPDVIYPGDELKYTRDKVE